LGDDFSGMLVSDCLSSYDPGEYAKHKCVAHHVQEHKADASSLNSVEVMYTADDRALLAEFTAKAYDSDAIKAMRVD